MQTIENLKELGFHTNNFVICTHPASVVDLKTKQQAVESPCPCCGHIEWENEVVYVINRLHNVTPEIIEKVNNAKLVSVFLPVLRDRKNCISFQILDNELIGYED